MDKQNISSQGQNIIDPTQKLSNQNLLRQQVSHTQQFQNQEGLLKKKNQLDNFSMISEQTLKRQVKSQIIRKYLGQNGIFKNAMCQIINQKESQQVIVSYQDQQDKSFILNLSSKNSNDQKLQQQHQIFVQQDKNCSRNGFSQNEDQLKQKQIIKQITSSNQINCQKLKSFQQKTEINLQQDGQQHYKEQALKHEKTTNQAQLSKIQNNKKDDLISQVGQLELNNITIQQEIQSKTNQQQFEIIKSAKKLSNLSYSYASQLNKIFGEIVAYKYTECEKKIKFEQKDLIIGFFQDQHENFDDFIFKIIYNSIQSDIDSQTLILQTLGFQFELIKLDQENISIIILQKDDFLSIRDKLEQLVQFEQNIEQIENNYDINSQNCLECTICEDQNTCENQNCFKNIKSRIQKFLQKKKYSYSKYENKLVKGILFQLSKEKLITEYLNFVHNTIFSFLENDQIDEQNISQQQLIQITESVSEKKQISSLEEINQQINNVDIINEYSFLDYKVFNQNQEKIELSTSYQMQWDVNIFNYLNKLKVSDRFLKLQNDIIQILKTKNYFLCQCFVTNQQEDIFIGYQEEIKEKYTDYVFVIKYNPIDSEIQKYLQIKQFNKEINHFLINDFVHILILAKDVFLQVQNKVEKAYTITYGFIDLVLFYIFLYMDISFLLGKYKRKQHSNMESIFNEFDIQQLLDKQQLEIYQFDLGNRLDSSKIQLKRIDINGLQILIQQSQEEGIYTWEKIICCICTNDVRILNANKVDLTLLSCKHFVCTECFVGVKSNQPQRCPVCRTSLKLALTLKYDTIKQCINENNMAFQSMFYKIQSTQSSLWQQQAHQKFCCDCLNQHEIQQRPGAQYCFICEGCDLAKTNIEISISKQAISLQLREQIQSARNIFELVENREKQILDNLMQKYEGKVCRIHKKGYASIETYNTHMIQHNRIYSFLKGISKFFCQKCFNFTCRKKEDFDKHMKVCNQQAQSQKMLTIMSQFQNNS
ncbi:hypothetical protein ABPG72_020493 [Tetrahymena utriculariae]